MCGIVGLFLKDESLQSQLGSLVESMLSEMGDRGPDSAGFAIYRDPVDEGEVKITLSSPEDDYCVGRPGRKHGVRSHGFGAGRDLLESRCARGSRGREGCAGLAA